MTKLNRLTAKIFGETASTTNTPKEIGQFGSAKAGTYNATGDVAVIQSLPAWSNGWIGAVTPTDQFPPLPEMTGVHKVLSYQNAYLLQQGIPEWDSATTYYGNGFCTYNGIIYRSILDENVNNQPNETPGAWSEYGTGDDFADQDINNLTTLGNARLQYAPFAINAGTVLNGENNTLHIPPDSSTIISQWVQPIVTSNTSNPDFIVSANTSTTSAYRCFDGIKGNTGWGHSSHGSFSGANDYVQVQTTNVINISQLTISNRNPGDGANQGVTSGSVQVSADGITWTNVKNWTNSNVTRGASWNIDLDYQGYYNYFRFYVYSGYTAISANQVAVAEISITATYLASASTSDTIICDPCTITAVDGKTKVFEDTSILNVLSVSNGSYLVFKNYTNSAISLVSDFKISKTAPSSPSSGDYWLDISATPANLKIYDTDSWVVNNDLVYIGDCTVNNGNVTSITNRYFNACPYYRDMVESYQNGTSWYTIYSDGWCEQGGLITINSHTYVTVNLLKPYIDTNFTIILTEGQLKASTYYNNNVNTQVLAGTTTNSFYCYVNSYNCYWLTSGYIA